ncbi:MAG TPA: hypothetical protein VLA42_09745 [Verrucomicrobiae bacterium]|nr:hypothetical protein [Verrucomicrobiae bacterium]
MKTWREVTHHQAEFDGLPFAMSRLPIPGMGFLTGSFAPSAPQ